MGDQDMILHEAVLSKDDLALSKLYHFLGESIIEHLRNKYKRVANKDMTLILEAVNEAFWGYYNNPATFNVNKSSLKTFLKLAAERDLLNILEKEKKQSGKINAPEDVELEDIFWNSIARSGESTDENVIKRETLMLIEKELSKYFSDDKDIQLAKMVLQGVRETSAFAEILQLNGVDQEKQRAQVKRNKDRITKVIERNNLIATLKAILQ